MTSIHHPNQTLKLKPKSLNAVLNSPMAGLPMLSAKLRASVDLIYRQI